MKLRKAFNIWYESMRLIIGVSLVMVLLNYYCCACFVNKCPDEPPLQPGSEVDFSALVCNHDEICGKKYYCAEYVGLDAEKKGLIEHAMMDWEVSTKGAIEFVDDDGDCLKTIFMAVDINHPKMREYQQPAGFAENDTIYFNVDRICGTRKWNAVIRHEMGHIFGISHVEDENSLMNIRYSIRDTPISVQTDVVQMYVNRHNCCFE